jgi:hypothetical protein
VFITIDAQNCSSQNPVPVLWWFATGTGFYGVHRVDVTYDVAVCVCRRQPGVTRLFVTRSESEYSEVKGALTNAYSAGSFWIDALRSSTSMYSC